MVTLSCVILAGVHVSYHWTLRTTSVKSDRKCRSLRDNPNPTNAMRKDKKFIFFLISYWKKEIILIHPILNLRDQEEADTMRPETKISFQQYPSSNTHKPTYGVENHRQLAIPQTSTQRTCFLCTSLHKECFWLSITKKKYKCSRWDSSHGSDGRSNFCLDWTWKAYQVSYTVQREKKISQCERSAGLSYWREARAGGWEVPLMVLGLALKSISPHGLWVLNLGILLRIQVFYIENKRVSLKVKREFSLL